MSIKKDSVHSYMHIYYNASGQEIDLDLIGFDHDLAPLLFKAALYIHGMLQKLQCSKIQIQNKLQFHYSKLLD